MWFMEKQTGILLIKSLQYDDAVIYGKDKGCIWKDVEGRCLG